MKKKLKVDVSRVKNWTMTKNDHNTLGIDYTSLNMFIRILIFVSFFMNM